MVNTGGILPTTKGVIYTCNEANGLRILLLAISNESPSNDAKINVFIHDGTSSRRICPVDWVVPPGAVAIWDNELAIRLKGTIEASTNLGGNVTVFAITGTSLTGYSPEL